MSIDYSKSFIRKERDVVEHLMRLKTDFRYFFYHVAWSSCCEGVRFCPSRGFDLLSEYAQMFMDKQIFRLAVSIPPRNSKSMIFSIAMPFYKWMQDPGAKFLYSSHGLSVLEDFQLKRQALVKHPDIIRQNPYQITKSTASRIDNNRTGTIISMPILNVVLGLGGDYLISDDPISHATMTRELADKTAEKYSGAWASRANSKRTTPMMIVSQGLSDYDQITRCVDMGYHHLSLAAIAEEPQTIIFPISGQIWHRDIQDVLNPEYEPLETLLRVKLEIGDENFAAQYQQKPVVAGSGVLSWDNVGLYDVPRSKYSSVYLTVDSAATNKSTSHPWGLAVLGEWTDERGLRCLDLLFAETRKADYIQGLDRVRQLAADWSPDGIVIENKSTGQALIPTLRLEHSNVVSIDPKGSKEDRTLQSASFFAQNRFRVPNVEMLTHTEPWVTRFKYEFCAFPKGRTDDILDATTQTINWINTKRINIAAFYGIK